MIWLIKLLLIEAAAAVTTITLTRDLSSSLPSLTSSETSVQAQVSTVSNSKTHDGGSIPNNLLYIILGVVFGAVLVTVVLVVGFQCYSTKRIAKKEAEELNQRQTYNSIVIDGPNRDNSKLYMYETNYDKMSYSANSSSSTLANDSIENSYVPVGKKLTMSSNFGPEKLTASQEAKKNMRASLLVSPLTELMAKNQNQNDFNSPVLPLSSQISNGISPTVSQASTLEFATTATNNNLVKPQMSKEIANRLSVMSLQNAGNQTSNGEKKPTIRPPSQILDEIFNTKEILSHFDIEEESLKDEKSNLSVPSGHTKEVSEGRIRYERYLNEQTEKYQKDKAEKTGVKSGSEKQEQLENRKEEQKKYLEEIQREDSEEDWESISSDSSTQTPERVVSKTRAPASRLRHISEPTNNSKSEAIKIVTSSPIFETITSSEAPNFLPYPSDEVNHHLSYNHRVSNSHVSTQTPYPSNFSDAFQSPVSVNGKALPYPSDKPQFERSYNKSHYIP